MGRQEVKEKKENDEDEELVGIRSVKKRGDKRGRAWGGDIRPR